MLPAVAGVWNESSRCALQLIEELRTQDGLAAMICSLSSKQWNAKCMIASYWEILIFPYKHRICCTRLQLRLTHDIQLRTHTRTPARTVEQHMNTYTAHGWQATHTLNVTACARWHHMIIILVENNVASYLRVTLAGLNEKQIIVRKTKLTAVIWIFYSRHSFLLNCCD